MQLRENDLHGWDNETPIVEPEKISRGWLLREEGRKGNWGMNKRRKERGSEKQWKEIERELSRAYLRRLRQLAKQRREQEQDGEASENRPQA